ncbi:hypothetical protein BCR43DRAFT_509299 [Syncephalastrum racemosum]|uniref:Uncharacterized protein n=1 Tax=Syncephalastrum racemosum TaxID=13706 RepID=A0A1X2GYX1_SYNRA|nr:hypothetical protein BCR43DRAFT_509299 [Syncephalastrum racemosum]
MANTGHADSYAGEMISGIVSREPRGYSCFGDVNRAAGGPRHLNVPPGLARDKPEPYQKWGITSAALIALHGALDTSVDVPYLELDRLELCLQATACLQMGAT